MDDFMKVTVKKVTNTAPQTVKIQTEFIKLEAALKFANVTSTGGEAKILILEGRVQVNGETCLMRGKKLYPGDTFTFENQSFVIA